MQNWHIALMRDATKNLQPKIADFEADIDVNFDNLLKTCRLSLLTSMYDSERVGKEFFPENSKREEPLKCWALTLA